MRALTIHQPWASLLACGAKKYETRSWKTEYRGKIAIHAGKTLWGNLQNIPITPDIVWTAMKSSLFPIQYFEELPRGCIIATAELVQCWEIHGTGGRGASSKEVYINKYHEEDDVTIIDGNEFLFGDFTIGRYAWEFANMTVLPEPIPARGGQRLWNWEDLR